MLKAWKVLVGSDARIRRPMRRVFPHGSFKRRIPDFFIEALQGFVNRLGEAYLHYAIVRSKNERWPSGVPLLSVVIPCFNYGNYVEEAVDSVLAQTFTDIEIIVVDGGSTDDRTVEILRGLHKARTKIFLREGRHLVGDNRNYGINLARGKYICCLDADDLLMPTYFEKALYVLETFGYDVVYPSLKYFGAKSGVWSVGQAEFIKSRELANCVSTVAIFKKSAWLRIGRIHDWGLREQHVPEDWDFWTRLLGHGYRFRPIQEPLMLYRVHSDGLTARGKMPLDEQKLVIQENSSNLVKKYRRVRKRQAQRFIVQNPHINLLGRSVVGRSRKILFVLPYLVIGGADSVYRKLIEALVVEGWDVSVVTTAKADISLGSSKEEYEAFVGSIFCLPDFLNESEYRQFIMYLLKVRHFDVIYMAGSELFHSLLRKIREGYPTVKIVDQLLNEFTHLENNRRNAKLIDKTIVAYHGIKKRMEEEYGESSEKISVITQSVDARSEFDPALVVAHDRSSLGASEKASVLAFFGRLSKEMRPLVFVKIIKFLVDRGLDVMGIMTGNGPLKTIVHDEICVQGLRKKIFATGFVEDVRPLMKIADVIVLPSTIEGMPMTLMEGFAMGVPALASDVGGVHEILCDGFNGFLCQKEGIEEMCRKAYSLCIDKEGTKKMGRNAREYALANFDISSMKEKYLSLFESLSAPV